MSEDDERRMIIAFLRRFMWLSRETQIAVDDLILRIERGDHRMCAHAPMRQRDRVKYALRQVLAR